MWLLPYYMAAIISRTFTLESLSLLFVCTWLFCLRFTLVILIKKWKRGTQEPNELVSWSAVYAVLMLVFALPLLGSASRIWVLAPAVVLFLAVDLALVVRRMDKSLLFEIAGIAGLTFSGPATLYVSLHHASVEMLWLWLFTFLYFVGTVFHVRLLKAIVTHKESDWTLREKCRIAAPSVIYFVGVIGGLLAGEAIGALPVSSWLLFAPSLLKTLHTLTRVERGTVDFRKTGLSEMAYAVLFGVLGVWVMSR